MPPQDPAPFLSIILPAHNEEHRLPGALESICTYLKQQPYQAEILVVENGSQDRTLEVAQAYARENPALQAIHLAEAGKGLAVRHGMLVASGEYRFMCDVDLSMPIAEVARFLPPRLADFDLAIGSREAPGAVRYNEPAYRHLTGRVYNSLIRLLALPDLHDTQCGFKCFRGPVADDLFSHQTLTGWSFDVEVLFIARQRKYRIIEIPIPWHFNPDSRVRLVHDSVHMGLDLLAIRQNARAGIYNHVAGA